MPDGETKPQTGFYAILKCGGKDAKKVVKKKAQKKKIKKKKLKKKKGGMSPPLRCVSQDHSLYSENLSGGLSSELVLCAHD